MICYVIYQGSAEKPTQRQQQARLTQGLQLRLMALLVPAVAGGEALADVAAEEAEEGDPSWLHLQRRLSVLMI